jgi:arylsulfatase A-like enzyme
LAVFQGGALLNLSWSHRLGDPLASIAADRSLVLATLALALASAVAFGLAAARPDGHWPRIARLGQVLPLAAAAGYFALYLGKTGSPGPGFLLLSLAVGLLLLAACTGTPRLGPILHICLLAALVSGAWFVRPRAPDGAADRGAWTDGSVRNVVLITIDTLRPGSLSCYDAGAESPSIDRIAADGILFERAISPAPWTLPALCSIMTGLLPSVHGAWAWESLLPASQPTLAELLSAHGYTTGAVGSNHLLTRGLSRGFHCARFFPIQRPWESVGMRLFDRAPAATTETLTDLSIDWIEANRDAPFFLWVHYFDPHVPYAPPSAYQPSGTPPPRIGRSVGAEKLRALRNELEPTAEERTWIKALYDGEVHYVDDNVGRLTAKLRQLGLYDDALIVVTSDHGEEFWEHESMGHGHSLHEEVVRVPLIVKLPRSSAKGRVRGTVTTRRVLPTVLDVCGIESGLADRWLESLAGTWTEGGVPAGSQAVLSSGMLYGEQKVCLSEDRWKFIRGPSSGREWFFDLRDDPGEQYALPPASLPGAAALRATLDGLQAAARALREELGSVSESVESLDVGALQALGYL